jgi:hypothetical protein
MRVHVDASRLELAESKIENSLIGDEIYIRI